MERKVLKYIVNFFLYLLIVFLLLGIFIKIEYKNKTGKDVIGMFELSASDFLEKYNREKELENLATIYDAHNMLLSNGGNEKDYIGTYMNANKAFNAGTAEFNRNVEAFAALDKDELFQREMQDVRRRFRGTNVGPKTMEFLIKSGLEGYSEDEMFKGAKEINPDATDKDIWDLVKDFKPYMDRDVRDFTANRISTYLDRQYENKLALLNKISEDYVEALKGTEKGKGIKRANEVFDTFKGKGAKERALISSVLNTLSLDDIKAITQDKGSEGYNNFMNFLSNLGDSTDSTIDAINKHSAMFAPVSSNIGGSFLESVISQHKGDDGLYKVIKDNPNMHNISRENIVYDRDGNPTFLYKNAVDIRKMRDYIQKYKEVERMLQGVRNLDPLIDFQKK
ncbi:hypothetical protein [Campylobacter fetus]|uniref:hypothetical protein n=1 Tax=Campylobacter fetus TaxID=196 RepID=UPI00168CC202|nr:hypothetical protein [Campylobacter fetus]MBD3865189.1 hypothetical protein [Campylobacter fetus]